MLVGCNMKSCFAEAGLNYEIQLESIKNSLLVSLWHWQYYLVLSQRDDLVRKKIFEMLDRVIEEAVNLLL